MKRIFSVAVLLFSIFSNAQIDFEKGYFISNSGDRVECYIKNLDWRNNPTAFEYKLTEDRSDVQNATIATVSEFGLNSGSKYKRFTVQIERSANQVDRLNNNRNPIWKIETLFLETLIEGDATLYAYCDGALFKYFYVVKNKPVEQLVHITYFDINQRAMAYNDLYKQQLFNALGDGKLPSKRFENVDYTRSSLIKIFSEYNAGNSAAVVNYDEKDKRKSYRLKVTLRANQASLSVREPNFSYNHDIDVEGKIVPGIGIEGEYIFAFNKNKWSIFTNPVYEKYKVEKNYVVSSGVNSNTVDTQMKIDYTSLEIPLGIRHYFFLNHASRIFVNASYIMDYTFGSTISFKPGNTFKLVPKSNYGFGIGYCYKSFSGEIRFNTPRELVKNDIASWSAKYSSFGFTLGYTIL